MASLGHKDLTWHGWESKWTCHPGGYYRVCCIVNLPFCLVTAMLYMTSHTFYWCSISLNELQSLNRNDRVPGYRCHHWLPGDMPHLVQSDKFMATYDFASILIGSPGELHPQTPVKTQWGCDEMAHVWQTTFSVAFPLKNIFGFSFKFPQSIFQGDQVTINQDWFK